MPIRVLLVIFCSASLATAGTPQWRGPAVTISSSGERLCAKHHVLLQATTVYGPDPAICILVQPTRKAEKARASSPNALPFGVSRMRSQLYSRAVTTSYCRECETFVQAHSK
jgi:hypothetical protein